MKRILFVLTLAFASTAYADQAGQGILPVLPVPSTPSCTVVWMQLPPAWVWVPTIQCN